MSVFVNSLNTSLAEHFRLPLLAVTLSFWFENQSGCLFLPIGSLHWTCAGVWETGEHRIVSTLTNVRLEYEAAVQISARNNIDSLTADFAAWNDKTIARLRLLERSPSVFDYRFRFHLSKQDVVSTRMFLRYSRRKCWRSYGPRTTYGSRTYSSLLIGSSVSQTRLDISRGFRYEKADDELITFQRSTLLDENQSPYGTRL